MLVWAVTPSFTNEDHLKKAATAQKVTSIQLCVIFCLDGGQAIPSSMQSQPIGAKIRRKSSLSHENRIESSSPCCRELLQLLIYSLAARRITCFVDATHHVLILHDPNVRFSLTVILLLKYHKFFAIVYYACIRTYSLPCKVD